MSGGATAYAEGRIIDFLFGTAPAAGTGASYVSLHTGSPPTSANEVSGASYARQSFAYTKSGGDPTTATNSAAINFPTATAAYGTITTFALWDAVTGGNMIAWGTLATAKPIASGDQVRFLAGALTVTAD
jgi:hypothetical protein